MVWVPGQDANSSDAADQNLPSQAPPELREVAQLLRQARENQGIPQADLAQRLHMGLQQLEALEQADCAALPEPVFVIAQARRVADALGLEISDAIDRLRRCEPFGSQGPALRPEAFARPAPNQAAAVPAPPLGAGGRQGLRWSLLVALAAGISIGAWQLQRQRSPVPVASAQAPAVRPQPRPAAQPETVLLLQARQPSWLEVRSRASGAVLFRGTLVGERRFALAQGLRVLAGRPDRVLVSLGSSAPRVLGPITAVQWFSFGPAEQRRR